MANNERLYSAHTFVGGEESNLTLEQARDQVRVWEEKGYHGFVSKPTDPEWEDTEDEPEFTSAAQFALAFPHRDVAIQYAKEMLQAVDCEINQQDGYFEVYDELEGA